MSSSKKSLSYRDAGVDIDAGNRLVERIRDSVSRTRRPEVLGGLGGFGGLFQLDLERYRQPVLVGATDGVGTKLKLALQTGAHEGIGIDLVAMCVNDIIVQGAEPLFFLDYYATGQLDVEQASVVIKGIAEGCTQAGAALIGGETAEMPGMYQQDDYDLAGFCVGIVDREKLIDGSSIKAGDALIAIASSGPHSNGYSLIRRIIDDNNSDLSSMLGGDELGGLLMRPTRVYVKPILSLMQTLSVKGIAHITGGGLTENLPRILPQGCGAAIDMDSWQMPDIFSWLQNTGNIAASEMRRTFNCGVGMIVVVDDQDADTAINQLMADGEQAWRIGAVSADHDQVHYSR